MNSFVWDRCFVTGVAEVDAQHQFLVSLINRFSDTLMEGANVPFEAVTSVFAELADYAQYHFDEEETLMDRVGVDARHARSHRAQHAAFVAEVAQMRATLSPGAPEAARQLLNFLVHWLAFHILGEDQCMARQLASIAAGLTGAQAYEAEERPLASSTDPLVRALSGLFTLVSERNAQLIELNRSLEAKVASRTSELVRANRRLEAIAITDVLTGLPNRRHALERLRAAWSEATERGTPLALMMIDADGFKEVNDAFGHDAGDEVLRRLARALAGAVRTDDLVCRLGGDEFLVLCPNTDLVGGHTVAEHVRAAVEEIVVAAGEGSWSGSVSVGVAALGADTTSELDLIRAADEALGRAKRAGRNRVATVA